VIFIVLNVFKEIVITVADEFSRCLFRQKTPDIRTHQFFDSWAASFKRPLLSVNVSVCLSACPLLWC